MCVLLFVLWNILFFFIWVGMVDCLALFFLGFFFFFWLDEGFFRWDYLLLQGIIAKSYCKELLGVIARSYGKELWQGIIARNHCKELLQGVMVRGYYKELL